MSGRHAPGALPAELADRLENCAGVIGIAPEAALVCAVHHWCAAVEAAHERLNELGDDGQTAFYPADTRIMTPDGRSVSARLLHPGDTLTELRD